MMESVLKGSKKKPKEGLLQSYLAKRQRGERAHRGNIKEAVGHHIPDSLKERELPGVESFDKVFASLWLNSEVVAIGTKCNQLALWNVLTGQFVKINLPRGPSEPPFDNCGIHSLCLNEEKSFIASGGSLPNEIVVFDLPSFQPRSLLSGHRDWVFGMQFIDHKLLISGGRDCQLNLWSVDESHSTGFVKKPLVSRSGHSKKIRDIKYNRTAKQLVSLSADEFLKVWDVENMDEIFKVRLEDRLDLVCLDLNETHNLAAVGSQNYITLIDLRAQKVSHKIASLDEGWGVRSLSFHTSFLSIGGGAGHLSFYDLRTNSYLKLENNSDHLLTGQGWLCKDTNYFNIVAPRQDVPNAICTHSYDPCGTKIFVGGGPLLLGLKGSYAAVW